MLPAMILSDSDRALKRYCSTSVLLKKWEQAWVTNMSLKPCSTIFLFRNNRFNPIDSRFEISWHQKKMTLQNFWQNRERFVRYNQTSRKFFCNKLSIYRIPSKITNAMFNVLQKSFQSHPFLLPRKIETQVCQLHGVKRRKSLTANKSADDETGNVLKRSD